MLMGFHPAALGSLINTIPPEKTPYHRSKLSGCTGGQILTPLHHTSAFFYLLKKEFYEAIN